MAATPITVYDREECAGHIVTVWQELASTGATTVETITLNAGYPSIDLSKAHPVISILNYHMEGDDCSAIEAESNMDDEIARGTAPTAAGDFTITGYMSVDIYFATDVNGMIMMTYWAAGSKQV